MVIDEVAARFWPGRGIRIEPIEAGLTNHNYRVEVDGAPLFVRLPGQSTDLLAVDRANELHNTRAAAATGVGPRVVDHDQASGALASSWQAEPVQEWTYAQLARRLPGSIQAFEDAARAGIVDRTDEDGKILVRSPRAVELGELLHALGIPVDALAAEAVALREDTDRIADRLMTLFLEHMWRPYAEAGRSSDDYERLLGAIEALRTVPADMVVTMLAQSLRRRLDEVAANASEEDRGITAAASEA